MSNASDRNQRVEDFAPKWARDPALRERRPEASRAAAGEAAARSEPVDEAPPLAPSAARRDFGGLRVAHGATSDETFEPEEDGVTDLPRISRSLDPTMMREPPRRPPTRGLFAFLGASAVAAAVLAVIILFFGGKVSFESTKAGTSASDANSAPKVLARDPAAPPEAEQRPAAGAQVASAAPVQVANAAPDPRAGEQELPASTPVRKAIGDAPLIRGVSENEIKFGISAPFTGPAKELGQQMKLGIETAFSMANEKGGVNGRQLSLVAADDGYEPERTAETMKQLYDKYQVFGIVGNVGTPTATVALPYALEKRMLFFGAFTGAGLLRRDPPDRYVINYRASYAEETDAVVRYLVKMRRLRTDQIAVFAQQDA